MATGVRLLDHVGCALRDDFSLSLRFIDADRTPGLIGEVAGPGRLLTGDYPERATIPLVPTGHHVWPTFFIEAGQASKMCLFEERGDLCLFQTANPSTPALITHRLLSSATRDHIRPRTEPFLALQRQDDEQGSEAFSPERTHQPLHPD
jgi:hypothetical protein